ncbi:MAG TPA: hypothetical protein VHN20_18390, partial [Beijerinckiaceae bacterium]|nr:hypothetical protein [Beijerinckiaceae bacterium]
YGYATPADVADQYPRFFWSKVEPFIADALTYLELTVDGRQWIANLYCNVFEIEHGRRSMGPHDGDVADDGARVGDGSRFQVQKAQRGAKRRGMPQA